MPGEAAAPATPALTRTPAHRSCFPQPGTKTPASQPGWCGWSRKGLPWHPRHPPQRASIRQAQPSQNPYPEGTWTPKDGSKAPYSLQPPGRGSSAQTTLQAGKAVAKEDGDSVARLVSHGMTLGWRRSQLSPCNPMQNLMGSHITPWGTSSSLAWSPELRATRVPAGLCITSPCTPWYPAYPETLPQARGGSQGQPRATATPQPAPEPVPCSPAPPDLPQPPSPAEPPLSGGVGQSRSPALAPHSRRQLKGTGWRPPS